MARNGISYKDVAEAATQLVGQGRTPTVEQVRLILGTGSSTTIANHLRQWKANQEASGLAIAKEIPTELAAVMKGLWERVVNHAEEQVSTIEAEYQERISELEIEVEKYKTNNNRWQKLYDQWLVEKTKLADEKLSLEQALECSLKENTSLEIKQDSYLQQLRDKQDRIDELNVLHKQSQANLEHYRETVREQRLLDQQKYESQINQLQSEVKNHREQFIIQQEKIAMYQHEYKSVQQALQVVERSNEQAQAKIIKLTTDLNNIENDKLKHMNDCLHWQDQYEKLKEILSDKSNHLIDIQTEHKLLSQQLNDAKHQLQELQDHNKLLSHEKWTFAQEKAQLEGQLKQMLSVIDA